MINLRAIPILLALSFAPMLACGPKDTTTGVFNEDGSVNPKNAFAEGVRLLKTPDKKTNAIDYATAYDMFSKAAEAMPELANASYNAGWTAEQLGNYEQAATHYGKAYEQKPDNIEFLNAYADALNRVGRAAVAVDLFAKFVEANPEDLSMRNAYAEALNGAGRYDDAIKQGQEVLLRDAKNVAAYRNLSRAYFSKGEYAMSQLCAEKAKTMAEGDAGIYNNIGVTYLVVDNEPAAIEEFKTARQLNPNNLEANLNLGYVALNSGDFALALECFTKALENQPGNLDAKLGMAVSLRGTQDYEGAARLYNEIIKADPKNQNAYFNMVRLQTRYIKDYKAAQKYIDDFKNNNQVGPSHEVFQLEQWVQKERADFEAREAKRIAEEKARQEREIAQKKKLEDLKGRTASFQGEVTALQDCAMAIEMGMIEMGMLIAEQAQQVIDAEEFAMAEDMITLIDDTQSQLDALKPECGAGGGTPAPAPTPEGGGETPAPEEAPAPEGGQ